MTNQQLIDLMYAWLYITVGQCANTSLDPVKVKSDLAAHKVVVDPAIVNGFVAAVQAAPNAYKATAQVLRAAIPGWSGPTDHPTLVQLDPIFGK